MFRKISVSGLLLLALVQPVLAGGARCKEPAPECEKKIREILSGRKYLGITFESDKGLEVQRVISDSPADLAGIHVGDVIMIINGHDCSDGDVKKFKGWVHDAKVGSKVSLVVRRDGSFRTFTPVLRGMTEKQIESVVAAHLRDAHSDSGQ